MGAVVQVRRCFRALRRTDDGWAGRRLISMRKNRFVDALGGADGEDVAGEAEDHACRSAETPNGHGRERMVGEDSAQAVVADDDTRAAVGGEGPGAGSADGRAAVGSWSTADTEGAGCTAREEAKSCLVCEEEGKEDFRKRVEAGVGLTGNGSCCCSLRAVRAGLQDTLDVGEAVDDWRTGEVDDGCDPRAGAVVRGGWTPLLVMAAGASSLNANQEKSLPVVSGRERRGVETCGKRALWEREPLSVVSGAVDFKTERLVSPRAQSPSQSHPASLQA